MPAHSAAARSRIVRGGALLWISAIQFFIAQRVVQAAWTTPFSLARNFISDLGNTACAAYPAGSQNYVCSPWHALMNASFMFTGVTFIAGAGLVRTTFTAKRLAYPALVLVAVAGVGFVLVSLFPENADIAPHKLGAALHFVFGNAGLAMLGLAMWRDAQRSRLAAFLVPAGLAGLAATYLLVNGRFLGLGVGGMERVAAYPLPIGLIAVGMVLVRRRS